VIFLNGPIGVGKTTLGRALSRRLAAGFVDGDDHSNHDKPWYGSILSTSRSIVGTSLATLRQHDAVVIAYPLGCVTWVYFRRHFAAAGVRTIFVSLRASYAAIVDEDGRGRHFDAVEKERIKSMIAEGYQQRPFSDLIFDTDEASFGETVDRLEIALRILIGARLA
jgi:hypothetical protein